MLNINANPTQSFYFTLAETLMGSSSMNPTLVLLPKQGTISQSFALGDDITINPARWNIYTFTGSIDGGDYDYRVYSGSILLESGLARCVSGSINTDMVFEKSNQKIVFK